MTQTAKVERKACTWDKGQRVVEGGGREAKKENQILFGNAIMKLNTLYANFKHI